MYRRAKWHSGILPQEMVDFSAAVTSKTTSGILEITIKRPQPPPGTAWKRYYRSSWIEHLAAGAPALAAVCGRTATCCGNRPLPCRRSEITLLLDRSPLQVVDPIGLWAEIRGSRCGSEKTRASAC